MIWAITTKHIASKGAWTAAVHRTQINLDTWIKWDYVEPNTPGPGGLRSDGLTQIVECPGHVARCLALELSYMGFHAVRVASGAHC